MTTIDPVAASDAPSLLDHLARLALVVAIAVSALYQLQHYVTLPFSSLGRFALLSAVGLLAIAAAPRRILAIPPLFWLLGGLVLVAGLHTYVLFGTAMAVAGTTRFANVMVIAPLVALLFIDYRHIRLVLLVYVGVFFFALLTLLYQYWGGTLDALVGDYVAIRADLMRYMTVLGEPNVGGMIAVIGFILGIFLPSKRRYSVLITAPAVLFVLMSISKASVIGLVLACIAIVGADLLFRRTRSLNRLMAGLLLGLALIVAAQAGGYLNASIRSVLGQIEGEPSAFGDFIQRQDETLDSERADVFNELVPPFVRPVFRTVFGHSFGVAGSAAQEILGTDAGVVLPHNSYKEAYITGGLAMLAVVVLLMGRAAFRLIGDARQYGHAVDICALVCLAILTCWMLVYPVIYEPATGALFWALVGYGNRLSRPVV
jgi:hypothetical protein